MMRLEVRVGGLSVADAYRCGGSECVSYAHQMSLCEEVEMRRRNQSLGSRWCFFASVKVKWSDLERLWTLNTRRSVLVHEGMNST